MLTPCDCQKQGEGAGPLVQLYQGFGFLPTVILPPALGFVAIISGIFRYIRLGRMSSRQQMVKDYSQSIFRGTLFARLMLCAAIPLSAWFVYSGLKLYEHRQRTQLHEMFILLHDDLGMPLAVLFMPGWIALVLLARFFFRFGARRLL